jgi:hypothetical protein
MAGVLMCLVDGFWLSPNISLQLTIPAVADTVFPSRINGIIGPDQRFAYVIYKKEKVNSV